MAFRFRPECEFESGVPDMLSVNFCVCELFLEVGVCDELVSSQTEFAV